MDITASQVKALRDKTGAGMMECKKALVETNGDDAAAEKLLKERGLAAVAKRSERATSEGHLFVRQNGDKIAVVELVCETDFVAKNTDFIKTGEKFSTPFLQKGIQRLRRNSQTNFLTSLQRHAKTCLLTKSRSSLFRQILLQESTCTLTSRAPQSPSSPALPMTK